MICCLVSKLNYSKQKFCSEMLILSLLNKLSKKTFVKISALTYILLVVHFFILLWMLSGDIRNWCEAYGDTISSGNWKVSAFDEDNKVANPNSD